MHHHVRYNDGPVPKYVAATSYRGMENEYVIVKWHHRVACGNSGGIQSRWTSEEFR